MTVKFDKFHGAGNDFIIIDNRDQLISPQNNTLIEKLCDRRFGIGADGLMLLNKDEDSDFSMIYFNRDGKEGTLCGNGSRCVVAFSNYRNICMKSELKFKASDGYHNAIITNKDGNFYTVKVELHDVNDIEVGGDYCFLNTGSPHYVDFRPNLDKVNVYAEGRLVRFSEQFAPDGTNVNFVQVCENHLKIRTYERGVEDETYACGTGVTASVLAAVHTDLIEDLGTCIVHARGGILTVDYKKQGDHYSNIWLGGPAEFVFSGEIEI